MDEQLVRRIPPHSAEAEKSVIGAMLDAIAHELDDPLHIVRRISSGETGYPTHVLLSLFRGNVRIIEPFPLVIVEIDLFFQPVER